MKGLKGSVKMKHKDQHHYFLIDKQAHDKKLKPLHVVTVDYYTK